MKQNKRRTATVVYIFIFMLTVSGCVRKGKEQAFRYRSREGRTHGKPSVSSRFPIPGTGGGYAGS